MWWGEPSPASRKARFARPWEVRCDIPVAPDQTARLESRTPQQWPPIGAGRLGGDASPHPHAAPPHHWP